MTVRVRPEARADIFTAAHWYEDREPGLGMAFIAEVDRAFQRIELGPERYTLTIGSCGELSSAVSLMLFILGWRRRTQ